MDRLIDAPTPMFCKYSMWIGDALRSAAVAHVQRLIDARRGAHRYRRAAHVGDQAHRVFDVQAARLRRNVAGRAPAQVEVERRIALLGHDVAAVVRESGRP